MSPRLQPITIFLYSTGKSTILTPLNPYCLGHRCFATPRSLNNAFQSVANTPHRDNNTVLKSACPMLAASICSNLGGVTNVNSHNSRVGVIMPKQ